MRHLWILSILFLFSLSLVNYPLIEVQDYEPQEFIIPSQLINIERNWAAHIVVVNYDEAVIDESELLSGMPSSRVYATSDVMITYNIEYEIFYADAEYISDLTQVVMDNSVNGSETGTWLDETALLYQQTHLDEPQRIFYPRAGRVIDGYAVEEWLEANPFVPHPSLGYTLYLVNFSSLDTSGHGLEHWYEYHPIDPDTGEEQNWFRLEWDNSLNPNVTMDYANFGGRFNTYIVDPSAHQWYLKWCRIWWSDSIGTEYDFWTEDLEDKVAALNLGSPAGINALNVYLSECLWDPINQLFFPYQHQPASYVQSGLLRALVICMDVEEGTTVDSLRWVTDAKMQKAHLEELYPFISWDVQVDFLDIDEYPDWNTTFWDHATLSPDGTTIADGYGMFYDIRDNMRPQYIDADDPNINVFGVVFIKKQMEMHISGNTYTGLGGGGQTVIWKAWDRYYRPDEITPKDGISAIQLHETMHAIGFHHTWQHEHYSSDFSFGPMGYFAFHNGTASFDKNWVQGTYLDQMEAILWDDFSTKRAGLGIDERPETYVAEQRILELFESADDLYNEMDWLSAYDTLRDASDWIDRMMWSTLDDTAPVITNLIITPSINTNGFYVTANVTDDLSGVENVTVYLQIDSGDIFLYICAESSGVWVASIPAFTASSNVEVWIRAWDWGMNIAESTHLTHTITTSPYSIPDSSLYLYIMIIAGLAVVIVVIVVVLRKR
ncbi:hypothetical protein EU528_06870 [Candidatus Thorarchaeota archaeon]|nr:MAG: hypothetical protein EU528_06870 [Candidatus Thorarchaeota archaeon]